MKPVATQMKSDKKNVSKKRCFPPTEFLGRRMGATMVSLEFYLVSSAIRILKPLARDLPTFIYPERFNVCV